MGPLEATGEGFAAGRATNDAPLTPFARFVEAMQHPPRDDAGGELRRELAPLLTPRQRAGLINMLASTPGVIRAVAEAARQSSAQDKVAALSALLEGVHGHQVSSWLRRGGSAGGPLPRTDAERRAAEPELPPLRPGSVAYAADFMAQYAGTPQAFQRNYPVTAEVARSVGLSLAALTAVMREEELTASQAMVRAGALPPTHWQDGVSAAETRFVAHPGAYATDRQYADFAEITAQAAVGLYRRGVTTVDVCTFVAENKQHFQINHSPLHPPVFYYNKKHPAAAGINPTFLITEAQTGKENYAVAARAVLDRLLRHPDAAQAFEMPGMGSHHDVHAFLSAQDGASRAATRSSFPAVPPALVDALKQGLMAGERTVPIMGGLALRMPIDTPYGIGGALYIFEKSRQQEVFAQVPAPGQAVVRSTDPYAFVPGGMRYTLEVLLDQGTCLPDPARPGSLLRDRVTAQASLAIDAAIRPGQPVGPAMRALAGAWYDLSATSGGWTGGGAGTNHIVLAAAFERLAGRPMPGLTAPADLLTVSLTRDEFVQHFMSGALFRDGGDALRQAGVALTLPLPFAVPEYGH